MLFGVDSECHWETDTLYHPQVWLDAVVLRRRVSENTAPTMGKRRVPDLYRAPFPLYSIKVDPKTGLVITAGGGGASKTGIKNAVVSTQDQENTLYLCVCIQFYYVYYYCLPQVEVPVVMCLFAKLAFLVGAFNFPCFWKKKNKSISNISVYGQAFSGMYWDSEACKKVWVLLFFTQVLCLSTIIRYFTWIFSFPATLYFLSTTFSCNIKFLVTVQIQIN